MRTHEIYGVSNVDVGPCKCSGVECRRRRIDPRFTHRRNAGWLAGACVRLCASDAFMLLKFDSTRIRFTGCALPGRSSPFVVVPQLTHHRHRHRQAINKCVQEIACPVGGPRTSELHADALCTVWRVHRHRAIKKTVYCVTFHNMCVAFLFCAVLRNGRHIAYA